MHKDFLVAGVFTAIISLFLHLFWKFRTANSKRAMWKTLIPAIFLSNQRPPLEAITLYDGPTSRMTRKNSALYLASRRKPLKRSYRRFKRREMRHHE